MNPIANTPAQPGKEEKQPKKTETEILLAAVRQDMKVEILSAIIALAVGLVIFEITFITVLMNLTGWTVFWVGVPGLVVSALLLFVVYVLLKHKRDLEKLAGLLGKNAKHEK